MTAPTNPNLNLLDALLKLQAALPRISKSRKADVETKTGRKYQYKFANLADVTDQAMPEMAKLGLIFTCLPTLNAAGAFVMEYELVHAPSGETKSGVWPLSRGSAQETGSELTYARRQCLCAVTGIAPEDDDDAGLSTSATRRNRRQTATGGDDGPGVNAEQQRQMNTLFRQTPIESKEERLAFVVQAIERNINSATELTRAEAGKVIARLESYIEKNQPPADPS